MAIEEQFTQTVADSEDERINGLILGQIAEGNPFVFLTVGALPEGIEVPEGVDPNVKLTVRIGNGLDDVKIVRAILTRALLSIPE